MPFPVLAFVKVLVAVLPLVGSSAGSAYVVTRNSKGMQWVESLHEVRRKKAAAEAKRIAAEKALEEARKEEEELRMELEVLLKHKETYLEWLMTLTDESEVTTEMARYLSNVILRIKDLTEILGVEYKITNELVGAKRTEAQIAQLKGGCAA